MASPALVAPHYDASAYIEAQTPAVLVVDNDSRCIDDCARMLDDLNYRHHCVTSGRDALERIVAEPTIQIVLANMEMPSMDGFVLLDEARARVGAGRPIAAIMLTERISADLAIRGMHIEAVDLLCKPLQFEAYSGALRRATRYLGARRIVADGASMSNFSQQLSRLVSVLEGKSLEPKAESKANDQDISGTLRAIIASRSLRNRYFPSQIFADPAWDILLDLTRAKFDGQQVSVSSVCIAASVPMSTALRWVRQMTDTNLLRRWTDPKDRRRDLIALTDTTAAHMRDYLAAVHSMLAKI